MEDVDQLTRNGRRKKPDKWSNVLNEKLVMHDALTKTAAQLEEEHSRLRDKELLLTQVLDTLQALVVDAVKQPAALAGAPAASTTPPAPALCSHQGSSSHQPAAWSEGGPTAQAAAPAPASSCDDDDDANRLLWMVVVDAVQQREAEISRMYGLLADSLGPRHLSSSTQQRMQEMLKALCSPDNVTKVSSMTMQQLTARLSVLAGQIALRVIATNAPHPATASISGPLQACYMEYSSLLMTAMIWHNQQFKSVLKTNLETQEMFAELPTGEHWLKALQQLQLTEQQLHVLCCVFDRYTAGVDQLTAALEHNLQQQAGAHNVCVANLLKQQQQQGHGQAGAATTTAGQQQGGVPADPAGAGCPPACRTAQESSHQRPPAVAHTHQQQQKQLPLEALLQEQQQLLRQWLLLALHLGIVTACTLSTYQQALFVTGCYPSMSRMDMAIAALKEQRRQQQQSVQGSSPQLTPTGSSPSGKEAPGTPESA